MARGAASSDDPGAIGLWTQRARGVGLLIGFAVTFLVSRGEGLPVADSALRGVVGALVMSVVCWWCALMVITGLIRTALHRQNSEIAAAAREAAAARAHENERSAP
jgi:hypothetical protein